ncbi:hypothetical protein [Treponema phagedenis]|nr:hypothetical protein [Treponema phagedenis]NVP22887.1 hypothetical protein [Treponema phagedenis]QKS92240.1 hypothetical protein HPJ96_06485 [Treponema phagedenis]QLC57786.1 hypothetical protein HW453_02320 [Treponema phagedenis]
MKSQNEELINLIIPILIKKGLFLSDDMERYKEKLETGNMKTEAWLLVIKKLL